MDRESNSATQATLRRAGAPSLGAEVPTDSRSAHRLRGWAIAVGASLILWGALAAVAWLVGTALS